jgi:hypothetical protein
MANNNLSTFTKAATDFSAAHLALRVKSNLVPIFFQLLGHGFSYRVSGGCTIKDLVCNQLGIHEDYLAERIQTIFLNSKVVDNVDSTVVNAGARLALSGPMPGLVGAILRSGGYYAAMRSQISHQENKRAANKQSVMITIKLLNIVAKELGAEFLQRGIRLKGKNLREFIERHFEDLKRGWIAGELDGQSIEIESLPGIDWKSDWILLQVNPEALA